MSIHGKPTAELAIDVTMVRALLQAQHDDLAHLPLVDACEGWDNRLFRLGDELAVRLPRRTAAAALVDHEQQWLPQLSPALPLPIPAPRRVGRPGCGFPWSWSVTPWFEGQTALAAPHDVSATAVALGEFVRALHQPAPESAPHNPWRSVTLEARTNALHEHLRHVGPLVDEGAVLRFWKRAVSTRPWPGAPLWIHGDLHPGNLLIDRGRLAAVIDFGDLAAGDPATDLSVAWMLFPPSARSTFLEAARGHHDPIDDDTVLRARGWALALGLTYLARSQGDSEFRALGLRAIRDALTDDDSAPAPMKHAFRSGGP